MSTEVSGSWSGGGSSTFATLRLWDEAAFRYIDVVECRRGRDARAEVLALHDPPFVIVVSARYGNDPAQKPLEDT